MNKLIILLVALSLSFGIYSTSGIATTINIGNSPAVSVSNPITVNLNGYLNEEGTLPVIDFAHYEIHAGRSFRASSMNIALADNGYWNWTMLTTDNIHWVADVMTTGLTYVWLYEGVTSNSGTAITPQNMKRAATRSAVTLITANATVSSNFATLISAWVIPGGTGPQSLGGAIRSGSEFRFAPNREYGLIIRNVAGGVKQIGVNMQWYTEN